MPQVLDSSEALGHRVGRWLFLSPFFFKMMRLEVGLPVSIAVLSLGAVGSALARIEPVFFFYFSSARSSESGAVMFLFYWVGLFLLLDTLCYILFRRTGNDLQLFVNLSLAALPLAVFPYIYMIIPATMSRYILLVLQVWTVLLISAALSFGKGLRLDRSILLSLIILYFNIILLILLGRLG
jgi:hypothetical protein